MKFGRTSIVNFLSQVVMSFSGFFGTVVLTRILGREQYGGYVVVMSVLAWATIAGNLGISTAVRKRVSEETEGNYVVAGFLSQSFLYVLVAVFLLTIRPHLNSYMGFEGTRFLIALLAARLLFNLVNGVLDGQHLVHISSVLRPIQMTSQTIVQVALVVSGFGLAGAFAGYFVGTIVAVTIGLYFASVRLKSPSKTAFHRLRTYAQFSWFASIQTQTFLSMDTIILAFFVTNSVIGGYKAAWNLVTIFAMFSTSIRRTLFPEISKLASQEGSNAEVSRLLREGLTYSGLFIIPGITGSAILGDVVLSIYGEGFAAGYYILLILGVAQLLYGYQSQFVNVIDGVNRPDITFRINALFVLLNFLLNIILTPQFGWYGAAFSTTVSAGIGALLGFYYARSVTNITIPFSEIGRQVAAAGLMTVVVLPGRLLIGRSLVGVVVLSGIGAGVYFISLLLLSEKFRSTVQHNLPFPISGLEQ
ncbi:polysaccharide biosynthesis C-terminal domain-containing protein [Halobacterium salinarum]|uniref:oligosaccharide flippase family protein n=1 Tax=Halobacterium salinarum TaxID=2242 RepID=UPI002552712C|nr:polysaccharide biosynthesis C-terminal domain-containing protein [Halobacterium salinarum]MDL0120416.1 polysaccharide biosynthesis C-terminal domain-containing protein [Halobacterium salinarum]